MRFREGFDELFDFESGVFALVVGSIAEGALDEGGEGGFDGDEDWS